MDTALVEHFVIFETFFGITAHTRDTIKNYGIIFLYLRDKLFPLRSVLSSTGEELSNDSGIGVDSGDVGNLSGNLLVLGTDAAISVDHNITFLFSIKTNFSFFWCFYYAVFGGICKRFWGKISTMFANVSFNTGLFMFLH